MCINYNICTYCDNNTDRYLNGSDCIANIGFYDDGFNINAVNCSVTYVFC